MCFQTWIWRTLSRCKICEMHSFTVATAWVSFDFWSFAWRVFFRWLAWTILCFGPWLNFCHRIFCFYKHSKPEFFWRVNWLKSKNFDWFFFENFWHLGCKKPVLFEAITSPGICICPISLIPVLILQSSAAAGWTNEHHWAIENDVGAAKHANNPTSTSILGEDISCVFMSPPSFWDILIFKLCHHAINQPFFPSLYPYPIKASPCKWVK